MYFAFTTNMALIKELLVRPWYQDRDISAGLRDIVMRQCQTYLLHEKRQGGAGICALDPVAHFHLSNGASIRKLNWMADLSERRLRESAGVMVNYNYEPPQKKEATNEPIYGPGGKSAEGSDEEDVGAFLQVVREERKREAKGGMGNAYVTTGEIASNRVLWESNKNVLEYCYLIDK